jgi:hypothetical protein
MRRRVVCTAERCDAHHTQVSIKGKKCFGKTPISYIAVSYGHGKGAPVCADNKCAHLGLRCCVAYRTSVDRALTLPPVTACKLHQSITKAATRTPHSLHACKPSTLQEVQQQVLQPVRLRRQEERRVHLPSQVRLLGEAVPPGPEAVQQGWRRGECCCTFCTPCCMGFAQCTSHTTHQPAQHTHCSRSELQYPSRVAIHVQLHAALVGMTSKSLCCCRLSRTTPARQSATPRSRATPAVHTRCSVLNTTLPLLCAASGMQHFSMIANIDACSARSKAVCRQL